MDVTEKQLTSLSYENKKKLIRARYASNFKLFLKELVYTLDESDNTGTAIKRIPDWKYLYDLVDDIEKYDCIYIWKSRQVFCTWLMCAYLLWTILFHQGKKVALQSKKSDDAEALLQRMKVIYDHLPAWKPEANWSYCRIKVPELYSDAFGVASGPDQLRSYTFSIIFSDELGFQEKIKEAFEGAKPAIDSGGQYIAVTTPPPDKNFAYKCKSNELFKEPTGKLIELHYSSRPDRDDAWKAKARQGYTEEAWNREYELQMTKVGITRIFTPFNRFAHVNHNLVFNPYLTLLRSWDFGFHRPACVFAQITSDDIFVDLYEVLGKDIILEDFAKSILAITNQRFPGAKIRDFCDVAGNQVSDKTEKTSIQMLRSVTGITPISRRFNKEDGFNLIRQKMSRLIGGRPAYQIHPDCQISIDAYESGYVYKKDGITACGDGINESEEEEREYYTHLLDARRYIFQNTYMITGDSIANNTKLSALKR